MSNPFINVGGDFGGKQFRGDGGSGWGGPGGEYSQGYGIGYDAVNSTGRRKVPMGRVLSEDLELRTLPRRQLDTTIRDLTRNFAVCAWMVRQHLNYVSTFTFRSNTGDRKLDQEINDWWEWWGRKENCDPGGRHSFSDLSRLWESLRTIDGDCILNRLWTADDPVRGKYSATNGMVQTIEGDRCQSFGGIPFGELGIDPLWVVNGVYVNPAFRALQFMIFRRPPNWTGLLWDCALSADFADLFGYFFRYDQVRGISPIAAAANSLRDVYENVDYALAKMKVSQLFAMAIMRRNSDQMGEIEQYTPPQPPPQQPGQFPQPLPQNQQTWAEENNEPRYKVNFGKGPLVLDMDPGDEAKVIESNQPSTQFREFNEAVVAITLKSCDLPYSFFDEAHSNYAGTRISRLNYEDACRSKRRQHRDMLDKITDWRLRLAAMTGDLPIPQKYLDQKRHYWKYQHIGLPWYDYLKEVAGSIGSINAGLDNPQRICHEHGSDFYENVDMIAEAREYAASKGVILATALPTRGGTGDDPAKTADQEEEDDDKTITDDAHGVPVKQAAHNGNHRRF